MPIVRLRCHVDLFATDFRYVIQKFGGARLFVEARVFGRIRYMGIVKTGHCDGFKI